MPAPKTAQGLQVEMRFTLDTEPVENVFHVLTPSSPPPLAHMQTVGTIFLNWWAQNLRGSFATTMVLREVYVTDLTLADGPTRTITPEAPIPGQHPDPALPNNVALVATKRTARRGRAYRGRTYFGGIPETVVTNSVASASYVADMNQDCAALLAILEDEGYYLGVLSKRLDGDWRQVGVISPVVSYALRNGRVDSQRNRLPA